jgi:hypothetical protein
VSEKTYQEMSLEEFKDYLRLLQPAPSDKVIRVKLQEIGYPYSQSVAIAGGKGRWMFMFYWKDGKSHSL